MADKNVYPNKRSAMQAAHAWEAAQKGARGWMVEPVDPNRCDPHRDKWRFVPR